MEKIDKSLYTPMMRQYLEIKDNYQDAIVFFRLGDFYEMFFSDAYLAAKELEIQLTARDAGAKDKVPMCGVPHHSSSGYIETLISKGYKVAICEQVEEVGASKGIVKRDVVRVITPGTYVESDDDIVYLASIEYNKDLYSVSYVDLSSGDTFIITVEKEINVLINELLQINPKEMIIPSLDLDIKLRDFAHSENILMSVHEVSKVENEFLLKNIQGDLEQKSFKLLLSYLSETQKRALIHLKEPELLQSSSYLKMDNNTVRNLELLETIRHKNVTGSLFWLINQCETALGSRFLKKQIVKPLINKEVIDDRLDAVEKLRDDFVLGLEIKELLSSVYDLERIVTKVSYQNVTGKDLLQLKSSIGVIEPLKDLLSKTQSKRLIDLSNKLNELNELYTLLDNALLEQQPLSIKEGKMFKYGYNKELDELQDISNNSQEWLDSYLEQKKEDTSIKKLKLGYNKVFGYYLEVPKGQVNNVKEEYNFIRKQTLTTCERYITDELKTKEIEILSSFDKVVKVEYDLFVELRSFLIEYISIIQNNANIIAEVDMLLAFNYAATELNLVKPTLTLNNVVNITDSFHPVVKKVMKDDVFIPNDIYLNRTTRILLITGPNMSGKSTYMRQMAITVILAQIGCYVPASEAKLPIFDKIFTRIGAADDLYTGKSTFMIEMLDANNALQNATKRSLILFDEIGRGTATYDGMALAQAILEYIHEKIGAITLFSTHYHELTTLELRLEKLKNVHVKAVDDNGKVVFLHKILEGASSKSYGINVAALAKLPPVVIKRAKYILKHLEDTKGSKEHLEMINLFNFEDYIDEDHDTTYDDIIDELLTMNLNELSPLDALNYLYALVEKVKQK